MAFILVQMLHGEGGHHAFRDYIFWEYLVGDEDTFLFDEEACKAYHDKFNEAEHFRLTAQQSQSYFTPREEKWAAVPKLAVAQFGRIITRWCYPDRNFFIDVVEMMANLFELAVSFANKVSAGGKTPFKGSDWDVNKNGPFLMWGVLWSSVEKYYFQTDLATAEKNQWKNGADFRKWWKYMKADMKIGASPFSGTTPEKFEARYGEVFFGWRPDATTPLSNLCDLFLKYLKGFVKVVYSNLAELDVREIKQRFTNVTGKGTEFKPLALWWLLSQDHIDDQGILGTPRASVMRITESSRMQGFITTATKVLEKPKPNDGNTQGRFDHRQFTTLMVLSGYSKATMYACRTLAAQDFAERGLGKFDVDYYINYRTNGVDFINFDKDLRDGVPIFGQLRKGALIMLTNWPVILREAQASIVKSTKIPVSEVAVDDPILKAVVLDMEPSDSVPQHRGVVMKESRIERKKRESEEDKGSMVPLIVGGCAVLALFVLSS